MKNRIIVLFDIMNEQDEYSLVFQIIQCIEKTRNESDIRKIIERKQFFLADLTDAAYRYIEEPISYNNGIKTTLISSKRLLSTDDISSLLGRNVHYHLRIHFNRDKEGNLQDVNNLQYLALLLYSIKLFFMPSERMEDKVTVFFVPDGDGIFPYTSDNGIFDDKTYNIVSKYMKLIANEFKGVLFGARNSKDTVSVEALNFHAIGRGEDWFPLIPIDYSVYDKLFNENIPDEDIKTLFELDGRRRYLKANSEKPQESYRDYILESSFRRLQTGISYRFRDKKETKHILETILKRIYSCEECSVMLLCLFAYLYNSYSNLPTDEVFNHTWINAVNLTKGIQQLVQNSIQYSEGKLCFFSFEVMRYTGENCKDILRIYLSDLNDKYSIMDKFVENLSEESRVMEKTLSLEGHRKLLEANGKKRLPVRNLFSSFEPEDYQCEWMSFREENYIAHVGLSILALTLKRIKAAIQVISSKIPELQNEKDYFCKSYGDEALKNYINENRSNIIPGTQYCLIIPVLESQEYVKTGIGQLQSNTSITEDYESFSNYIDFEEKYVPVKKVNDSLIKADISNYLNKSIEVRKWYRFWTTKFDEDYCFLKTSDAKKLSISVVFNHDFNETLSSGYFDSKDNIEICIKGLIAAISYFNERNQYNYYEAVTNLPIGFINIFREISVQYGSRSFPVNLQLFLYENNRAGMIHLMGDCMENAIKNSYILSLEQGVSSYTKADYDYACELSEILSTGTKVSNKKLKLKVFPFDALLHTKENDTLTIFEYRILSIAENELTKQPAGYKLQHTHMRLGSKIHIESFYEMSFLFYRTSVANRIAFLILREMKKNMLKELKNKAVLFYGYASYSKAILTSLSEIYKEYSKKDDTEVMIAAYQYNLQSISSKIQMYFGINKGFPGTLDKNNNLVISKDVYVIQIVPISSTLTTFDKMWGMLAQHVKKEKNHTESRLRLRGNYTAFWVSQESNSADSTDVIEDNIKDFKKEMIDKGKKIRKPSSAEKAYWKQELVFERRIETNFNNLKEAGCNEVKRFINARVLWSDPLRCKLCYPKDKIDEIPLIETDATSTVPAQQIRKISKLRIQRQNSKAVINNERLLQLNDCVYYGHFYRRQNHYQFYIDTQKFFQKTRKSVKDWLKGLSEKSDNEYITFNPLLHIIFSPEHNTNVGFAQYVNTHYFKGMAEIVSFNIDKEFRSNFICEHSVLIGMIERLLHDTANPDEFPVKFYYVDDTIITGSTFVKANSFLHSLIPEDKKKESNANLFDKVFVLVDRLSDDSKRIYVNNIEKNFVSYVHIDISNIRSQGDSCVVCKLKREAQRLYKRSTTNELATYWRKKIQDYDTIAYDDTTEMAKIDLNRSFHRMLMSHILQNVMIKSHLYEKETEIYDLLVVMLEWMLSSKSDRKKTIPEQLKDYSVLFKELEGIEGVKTLLKSICRPFITFDFQAKKQILRLFIMLTESFINGNDKGGCGTLYNTIDKICSKIKAELMDKQLDFLNDFLLEGLTDLNSTYLMRRDTFFKMYRFVKDINKSQNECLEKKFWSKYGIDLQRIIDVRLDETKVLWLEHLLLFGVEYPVDADEDDMLVSNSSLYQIICSQNQHETSGATPDNKQFLLFMNTVFLQNSCLYYSGLSRYSNSSSDDYFMKNWYKMIQLDRLYLQYSADINQIEQIEKSAEFIDLEKNLFDFLHAKDSKLSVKKRYDELIKKLRQTVSKKYCIPEQALCVALLTEDSSSRTLITEDESTKSNKMSKIPALPHIEILAKEIDWRAQNTNVTSYRIKDRVSRVSLEEDTYEINNKDGECPYIIVLFNDYGEDFQGIVSKTIEKVYLYIEFDKSIVNKDIQNLSMFILRDVLMYRYTIMMYLERDFSGDLFAQYSRIVGTNNLLSLEKATSHATTGDDAISIEIFTTPKKVIQDRYEILKIGEIPRWLLLRNYTNNQIAKLFNRVFRESTGETSKDRVPRPYIACTSEKQIYDESSKGLLSNKRIWLHFNEESTSLTDNLFNEGLKKFSQLGLYGNADTRIDGRFSLLNKIMYIDCEDVKDAEFIQSKIGTVYNAEYFRCIVTDILLSALKYCSDKPDFLLRVDGMLENRYFMKKMSELREEEHFCSDSQVVEEKLLTGCYYKEVERIGFQLSETYKNKELPCMVKITREKCNDKVDYLVFKNPVDSVYNETFNWKYINNMIACKLRDPLDFPDGHMSLFTIKKYIEGLGISEEKKPECVFNYREFKYKNSDDNYLIFETKLPVLKRET